MDKLMDKIDRRASPATTAYIAQPIRNQTTSVDLGTRPHRENHDVVNHALNQKYLAVQRSL